MGKRKGITLVALVITIIILLILAGITISLTIGQRGILNRAQEAGKNYQEAAKKEDEQLNNFLKETDNTINGITGNGEITTPQEPVIDVSALKAGDYIKYNTGITEVGENGIIVCRVLYPVNSPYGLQIISDENVENIELGGSTWEEGKASYNGAIETLNSEATKYVNIDYAYDGRCVGSIPIIENGIFIDKNKVRDSEGNIQNELDTIILPPDTWKSYKRPIDWSSDDTSCYNTDTNYTLDEIALKKANIWTTREDYWLASRYIDLFTQYMCCAIYGVSSTGDMDGYPFCYVYANGNTEGYIKESGLRPCISLKLNSIKIIGGKGTQGAPYIIGK